MAKITTTTEAKEEFIKGNGSTVTSDIVDLSNICHITLESTIKERKAFLINRGYSVDHLFDDEIILLSNSAAFIESAPAFVEKMNETAERFNQQSSSTHPDFSQ